MDTDTDTLIAMVLSILTVPQPETTVVLDALMQCDGDVQTSADLITARHNHNNSTSAIATKRKASSSDLTNWLTSGSRLSSKKPPSSKKDVFHYGTAERIIVPSATSSGSPSKPPINLMDVLHQTPTAKPSIPRLPPLTLSNPTMVAQHTPCTQHLSILPPELACKLFYHMLDLSRSWSRNRWWLFDRVVESPHRTSFFVREYTTDGSWHEAAQYWQAKFSVVLQGY